MGNNVNPKLLARWSFPNEIWREFIYFKRSEAAQNKIDLREYLFMVVGVLVVASIIAGLIAGILAVLGLLIIVATLFVTYYVGEKVILKFEDNNLKTETGDIKIFTNNVLVNEVIFFWGERRWCIDKIEKDYFPINEQFMMIFRIYCKRRTLRNHESYSTMNEERKMCIIPVPFGKEEEADLIISELSKQIIVSS